jgi:hypothetical protein
VSGFWTLIDGKSWSAFRGELIEGLLMGGGDFSLGDIGQRGVSLSSEVREGFWGIGALIAGSDWTGCNVGVVVADNALC